MLIQILTVHDMIDNYPGVHLIGFSLAEITQRFETLRMLLTQVNQDSIYVCMLRE